MKKAYHIFLLATLIALSLLKAVSAQSILSAATDPFANFNLTEVYNDSGRAFFIDTVIYLIIFLGVSTSALKQQFEGKKAVPVVIGVVLALSLSMGAQRAGFRLLEQGIPFAAVAFFAFIGITLFRAFTSQHISASWSILALWLIGVTADVNELLTEIHPVAGRFWSFFTIAAIVSLILIIKSFFGGKETTDVVHDVHGPGPHAPAPATHPAPAPVAGAALHAAADTVHGAAVAAPAAKAAAEHVNAAEELVHAELNTLEKLKEFLEKLRAVHFESKAAIAFAGYTGTRMKTAIRTVLDYHKRALVLTEKARHINYARLKQIQKVLQERKDVSAMKESDARNLKITAYLNNLMYKAWVQVRNSNKVVEMLEHIQERETEARDYMDELVAELAGGMKDQGSAQKLLTSILGAIDGAEQGLKEIGGFEDLVRRKINQDNPALKKVMIPAELEWREEEVRRHVRNAA